MWTASAIEASEPMMSVHVDIRAVSGLHQPTIAWNLGPTPSLSEK